MCFLCGNGEFSGSLIVRECDLTSSVLTGETEWAKSGRYKGTTDIGLTPEGISQVSSAATTLVGAGKLLDPSQLVHVFVSPDESQNDVRAAVVAFFQHR